MIASKDSFEPSSRDQLPNSTRVYVEGEQHKDIRVPMREIALNPTKSLNGDTEENAPIRVYDTSGPWEIRFEGNVDDGLPLLRDKWIRARGDVEEYDGAKPSPSTTATSPRHTPNMPPARQGQSPYEFPA